MGWRERLPIANGRPSSIPTSAQGNRSNAGIAILLACSAIAVWKLLDRAELHDEDLTFLSFISKSVSRLIGN